MSIFATVVRFGMMAFTLVSVGGNKAEPARTPDLRDVSPAQSDIPARIFNLDDFGGRSDGIASNTEALKRAIASVEGAGGGTLILRAGIYVTGGFSLCSRINLHLNAGALILFSPSEFEMGELSPVPSNPPTLRVRSPGTKLARLPACGLAVVYRQGPLYLPAWLAS